MLFDGVSVILRPLPHSTPRPAMQSSACYLKAGRSGGCRAVASRVTVLLRLPAGTDVEAAKAFLAERAFLPRGRTSPAWRRNRGIQVNGVTQLLRARIASAQATAERV